MPLGGMNRKLYLKSKFGSKEKANSTYQRIEEEGKLNNIYFQFDIIKKHRTLFSRINF